MAANGNWHAFWDDLLGEDAAYWDDSPEHQRQIFLRCHEGGRIIREGCNCRMPTRRNSPRICRSQVGLRKASSSPKPSPIKNPTVVESCDHVKIRPGEPILRKIAAEAGARYAEIGAGTAEVRIVLASQRLAERIKWLLGGRAPSATSRSLVHYQEPPTMKRRRLRHNSLEDITETAARRHAITASLGAVRCQQGLSQRRRRSE